VSDRYNTFYKQLISESELDGLCSTLEQADRDAVRDLVLSGGSLYGGVCTALGADIAFAGLDLTQGVEVEPGVAYDNLGRRIQHDVTLTPTSTLNVTHAGYTAIGAVGTLPQADGADLQPIANCERWISIYIVFDRLLSDQRTDGTGTPVYYSEAESFKFYIQAGVLYTLGAAPVTPAHALMSGMVLLGEFKLVNNAGVLTVALANYERRQDWIRQTTSQYSLVAGTAQGALQWFLSTLTNHVTGSGGRHSATAVDVGDAPVTDNWRDTGGGGGPTTNAGGTVKSRLDKLVTDLVAQTANRSGAHKIGAAGTGAGALVLPAGNIGDQIRDIVTTFNAFAAAGTATTADQVAYDGSSTAFADATVLAARGLGLGVDAVFDDFVGLLGGSAAGAGLSGADKIGARYIGGSPGTDGTLDLAAGTLSAQLAAIQLAVNGRVKRVGDTMTGSLTPNAADAAALGSASYPWSNVYTSRLYARANADAAANAAAELRVYSNAQQTYLQKIFALGNGGAVATLPVAVIGPHGHYQPRSFEYSDHFMYKDITMLAMAYDLITQGAVSVNIPSAAEASLYTCGGIARIRADVNGEVGDIRGPAKLTLIGSNANNVPRQHFVFRVRRSRTAGAALYSFGIRRRGSGSTIGTCDTGTSRVEFYAGVGSTWQGRVIAPAPAGSVPTGGFTGTDDTDWHLFEIVMRQHSAPVGNYAHFAVDGVWRTAIRPQNDPPQNGFVADLYDFEFFARLDINGDGGQVNDLDIDYWAVYSDTYGHDV